MTAVFFRDFAVADTIDGRFDVLALHVWLVLDEFQDRQTVDIGQQFVDALFVQFDEALRGGGILFIGDPSVTVASSTCRTHRPTSHPLPCSNLQPRGRCTTPSPSGHWTPLSSSTRRLSSSPP